MYIVYDSIGLVPAYVFTAPLCKEAERDRVEKMCVFCNG